MTFGELPSTKLWILSKRLKIHCIPGVLPHGGAGIQIIIEVWDCEIGNPPRRLR